MLSSRIGNSQSSICCLLFQMPVTARAGLQPRPGARSQELDFLSRRQRLQPWSHHCNRPGYTRQEAGVRSRAGFRARRSALGCGHPSAHLNLWAVYSHSWYSQKYFCPELGVLHGLRGICRTQLRLEKPVKR